MLKHLSLEFSGVEQPPNCIIPHKKIKRPSIALALSGGGLRGVAQIGVLKVLQENNIPIDFIAGSSIGSVIGGLYASGYSPDEIWQLTRQINWLDVLIDEPSRASQFLAEKQKRGRAIIQFRFDNFKIHLPEAFTPGQKLTEILTDIMLNAPCHEQDFNKLRVPLHIVSTDILTGNKVILQNGDLVEAMRASIAIPLLLSPVEFDSLLLADGGLRDNIPVDEARAFGADLVIAVNTTSNLRPREQMNAPWEIADQVTTIMQQEHNEEQLKKSDVVIDFRHITSSSTSVEDMTYIFEEGQKRARDKTEEIQALFQKQMQNNNSLNQDYNILKVQLDVSAPISLDSFVDTTGNRAINETEIIASMKNLYASGYFNNVSADIILNKSDTLLTYKVEEKPVLKSVKFIGNSSVPDTVLAPYFRDLFGKPINQYLSKKAISNILKHYRFQGFSLCQVSHINFDSESGVASIYLTEGRISDITFTGNETTKEFVISREFALQKDKIFNLQKAKEGINNIYATGLFQSVILRTMQQEAEWNINVHLKEKKFWVARFGAHYNEERKGRTFMELSHENILGYGNEITLHGQYGNRDMLFSLNLNANRLLKTYFTSQIDMHHDVRKNFYYENFQGLGEYERRSSGGSFSLGTQIERFGTVFGIMRMERIHIRTISGYGYDTGKLNVNTLGINMVVDTRNQVPFPTSGKYHRFSYEVSSGKFLGADISYFKVENQFTTYWTIMRRNTFSPTLWWGSSDLTTPFSEQFRVGGADTFLGLREGEMQGRNMIIGSMEYRFFIPWKSILNFYLSFRFETGSVWKNSVDVKAHDFIIGRGISFAADTPFGSLSISYGRASNGKQRLYLSAGYNF